MNSGHQEVWLSSESRRCYFGQPCAHKEGGFLLFSSFLKLTSSFANLVLQNAREKSTIFCREVSLYCWWRTPREALHRAEKLSILFTTACRSPFSSVFLWRAVCSPLLMMFWHHPVRHQIRHPRALPPSHSFLRQINASASNLIPVWFVIQLVKTLTNL